MKRAATLFGLILIMQAGTAAADGGFRLSSPDIQPGQQIAERHVYDGFGCRGANLSPALSWDNVPEGTRSFALMVHDPDAPTGSGWWHWVVWNIPADTRALPAGAGQADGRALPAGAVQGNTDFGGPGYGGPCPPPGAAPHRYFFRLHALSVEQLELPATATAALVGFNVNAHTIAVAELQPVYSR